MRVRLRDVLYRPSLDTMNFLNEVVSRFPEAVSFAPGRPAEALFDVRQHLAAVDRYVAYAAKRSGLSREACFNGLGQYGRTNGIIAELIADHLAKDEGIRTEPGSIMVTSGCQEAMAILLMGLFESEGDVLLVSDPAYIGITGIAEVLGVETHPVICGPRGLEAAALEAAIGEVRRLGKRPVAVYDCPDFNNPLGTSVPVAERARLLALVAERGLLFFEDNPYGQFAYDSAPLPTLKSMDEHGCVIYLGTFSKTMFPGLRVGFLVADQKDERHGGSITEPLSKIKSFVSVNTSQLLQAIVGGMLLINDGSLKEALKPKVAHYREHRDHMLAYLERTLAELGVPRGAVVWNRPSGGFFLTIRLPFEFDESCMRTCAADYGVICCPMSMFSLSGRGRSDIRLSFSYVTRAQIEKGIRGLSGFIADRIASDRPAAAAGKDCQ